MFWQQKLEAFFPNITQVYEAHSKTWWYKILAYSALPYKRTGTFIFLKPKFPPVRSFLSGTPIN